MLNRCSALVFSDDGSWSEAFCSNLKTVGFLKTHCVGDFEALERTISKHRINFCFFSQMGRMDQLRAATQAVRVYGDEIRFSPLFLMAREISQQELGQYLSVGFDDIVQSPCTLDTLRSRIKRQLNNVHNYYETEQYFGPDRRRNEQADHQHKARTGMVPYRRYSIRRDVFKGVEIMDIFDHKPVSFADALEV
ncbi:hypothetical protein [Maritalea sp.]|uniref:hypothetical protein n=1 Tax=Maritalea sp. TaxID=2003361 RepID=UPI003EFA1143